MAIDQSLFVGFSFIDNPEGDDNYFADFTFVRLYREDHIFLMNGEETPASPPTTTSASIRVDCRLFASTLDSMSGSGVMD